MKKDKKGISPLIATVLVIGFTIVLAALVITWGTKLFKTTVSETETAAKFSQACSAGLKVEVVGENYDPPDTFTLTLRNNNQNQAVNTFRIVLNYNDNTRDVKRAMRLGRASYLIKAHYTPTEVVDEVKRLFREQYSPSPW